MRGKLHLVLVDCGLFYYIVCSYWCAFSLHLMHATLCPVYIVFVLRLRFCSLCFKWHSRCELESKRSTLLVASDTCWSCFTAVPVSQPCRCQRHMRVGVLFGWLDWHNPSICMLRVCCVSLVCDLSSSSLHLFQSCVFGPFAFQVCNFLREMTRVSYAFDYGWQNPPTLLL